MPNGNGEPVPPQPGMPLLEGVPVEGRVGRVEEPVEAVSTYPATFDGPRIFVHAPWYECVAASIVDGRFSWTLQL